MYAAINKSGSLIYASQVVQPSKETYHCPKCGQSLILKRSRRGRAFFSHSRPCGQVALPSQGLGETASHRAFKSYLLEADLGTKYQLVASIRS